jgi:3-oxoacyl-[acyl-carrier-protein] synthase-1/3-oxoacyl-[acyl-carrier-protein] synthase II
LSSAEKEATVFEMKRRVVIAGMGTFNLLGDTLDGCCQALIRCRSGTGRWRPLDLKDIESKIGGDLGDYDFQTAMERVRDQLGVEGNKKVKKLFRSTSFSAKAAALCSVAAWKDAGLLVNEIDPLRSSVIVGG